MLSLLMLRKVRSLNSTFNASSRYNFFFTDFAGPGGMPMFQSKFLVLLAGIALLPCCALAQKNEISFSAGAAFGDDQSLAVGDPSQCSLSRPHCQFFELLTTPGKLALEGSFAHRLFAAGPVSLHAEVPVFVVPHHK